MTPDQIRHAKKEWINLVKSEDRQTARGTGYRYKITNFYFLNLQHLNKLCNTYKIVRTSTKSFKKCQSQGLVNGEGVVSKEVFESSSKKGFFWSMDLPSADLLEKHIIELLELLKKEIEFINLNQLSGKSDIASITPGQFIYVEGKFHFKKMNKIRNGVGQDRRGLLKKTSFIVEFEFDGWLSLSSSARSEHLSGSNKTARCLGIVRNISKTSNVPHITITCLALGT